VFHNELLLGAQIIDKSPQLPVSSKIYIQYLQSNINYKLLINA